jgi:hypothetical protein
VLDQEIRSQRHLDVNFNVSVIGEALEVKPLVSASLVLAVSLGVLHHIPDRSLAIKDV